MSKKSVIRLAAAAGVIIVLWAILFLRPKTGEMTLINEAGESAVKTTVEINGRQFVFDDIPPGGIRKLKYRIEDGNRYSVAVEFHYERKLELQTGYFTDRVKSRHRLIIQHNEVVLESGGD